jgi:hypothetical protein
VCHKQKISGFGGSQRDAKVFEKYENLSEIFPIVADRIKLKIVSALYKTCKKQMIWTWVLWDAQVPHQVELDS